MLLDFFLFIIVKFWRFNNWNFYWIGFNGHVRVNQQIRWRRWRSGLVGEYTTLTKTALSVVVVVDGIVAVLGTYLGQFQSALWTVVPIGRCRLYLVLVTVVMDQAVALDTLDEAVIITRVFGTDATLILDSQPLTIGAQQLIGRIRIGIGRQTEFIAALGTCPATGAVPTSSRYLVHLRLKAVRVPAFLFWFELTTQILSKKYKLISAKVPLSQASQMIIRSSSRESRHV